LYLSNILRLLGICGVLTPIVAFSCILSAIASYPQFSWFDNALSDLGVVSGITMWLFNVGLIFSGVLALAFGIGLFVLFRKSIASQVGCSVFVLSCLALIAIGVFPERTGQTHLLVSVMFFVLLPISLLILVISMGIEKQIRMASFTLALFFVAALPWVLEFTLHYVAGVAIPETISGLAGSVWVVILGILMITKSSQ
jgi:hypothetical membrane protein